MKADNWVIDGSQVLWVVSGLVVGRDNLVELPDDVWYLVMYGLSDD